MNGQQEKHGGGQASGEAGRPVLSEEESVTRGYFSGAPGAGVGSVVR